MQDMIVLPQEAKAHFDQKANSLIAELRPLPVRNHSQQLRGSLAHQPVAGHLRDVDFIGRVECNYANGLGGFRGFEIHGDSIHEFLPEEAAKNLEKITDKIARRRELRSYCSLVYVREHLVGWVRRRRLQEPADDSWTTDLLSCLKNDVYEQTILIPLQGIQITIPFTLGQVSFDYFTESSIEAMQPEVPEKNHPILIENRERNRKRYQSCVYAKFQCTSEKIHAENLAIDHTNKVLEILKLFDYAALEIRAQCSLGRMGQITPALTHCFRKLTNGRLLLHKGIDRLYTRQFIVDEQLLHILHQTGIGIASKLLIKTQLTDLEKRSLAALSHYAHGVSSSSLQERIIHALVAVESILHKDANEPVQSLLAYRIALLSTSKLEYRKQATIDLRKGYKLRSQFVHHGIKPDPDDVDTANRVLLLCWNTIDAVMELTKKFDTKQALLDSLEDELLTPH